MFFTKVEQKKAVFEPIMILVIKKEDGSIYDADKMTSEEDIRRFMSFYKAKFKPTEVRFIRVQLFGNIKVDELGSYGE